MNVGWLLEELLFNVPIRYPAASLTGVYGDTPSKLGHPAPYFAHRCLP